VGNGAGKGVTIAGAPAHEKIPKDRAVVKMDRREDKMAK
jgi:hypothetical protein